MATFRIRGTNTVPNLARVAALLGKTDPVIVGFGDNEFAQLRFGLAGNMLAVYAEVLDGNVSRNHLFPRGGSAIELFAARSKTAACGQVVLLPATADECAACLAFKKGTVLDATGVWVSTAPIKGGYRMSALVPLSLFGIDPSCEEFMFDCSVSTSSDVRGHHWRYGIGAWPEIYTRFAVTHSRVLVDRG